MKKYVSCFLFFFFLTAACLATLFYLTINREPQRFQEVQVLESMEKPALAEEETEETLHLVLNQEAVEPRQAREGYCLVAEEGYLIVYDGRKNAVDLLTHMPLSDFPVREQERLMEGIWFSTMAEIFSYLESYTS